MSAAPSKHTNLPVRNFGPVYTAPMTIWFTVFFLAPLLIIVLYSFLRKGLYGGVVMGDFTPDAYRSLSNPSFVIITLRTLATALIATFITIFLALPCGYFMARSKNQTFLLLLIIIPFWTNFLIRVFAWMNILGNNGFLNDLLIRIGLIDSYINFLYNQGSVVLVLVYMYLPYAILPLFSTIDKFDFSLLEAARDLGATKAQSIFRVLLPNIKSGLYTAVLFTFIPIFGAYAVPLLVGGKDSYMLGNVIADQLTKARNWPLASAISMVLTVITTAGVLIMLNLQRKDAEGRERPSRRSRTAVRKNKGGGT
ncbi:spermidine/putrescine ABC transporter permease [Spirochaetia bacterium]|nr:spermidine/putrescine ABC transporter permease [Spirochaetia bacterium]